MVRRPSDSAESGRGKGAADGCGGSFPLLCVAYSFSIDTRATRGASITGDEPFYLLTTQSLLADGDFDLANQYETRSYESFFDHTDEFWRLSVPQPDDDLLSPYNPGLSILVIPGFGLAGLNGVQIQLMMMGPPPWPWHSCWLTASLAFAG